MPGYLSLILHAHLPFVRHPEHERFLEEAWLFEAITETYIPLLQILSRWRKEGIAARLTLSLSPTLCSMLSDTLLQERYLRHLEQVIELAQKEVLRTQWEKPTCDLARFYHQRLNEARDFYLGCGGYLVTEFRKAQEAGTVDTVTTAATHAVLPLLAGHRPSVRAQVLTARDHYRSCFGRDPGGIWLPECAYAEELDPVLAEANLRWFVVDAHGLLQARPQPKFGLSAPVFTPRGVAAFGRDQESAKQVWSREDGYPGDPRYRDFYRDIGHDLDLEYLKPYLVADRRGFTGLKYYRITGRKMEKEIYVREAALAAVAEHAEHFVTARLKQLQGIEKAMDRPPIVVAAYDAELFGHWWYEGPEFLDAVVRRICSVGSDLELLTPGDYLRRHPTNQVATPSASSWGELGYWRMWLNESNQWIYPHLHTAQERMSELVGRFGRAEGLKRRALRQAGRELLLAQASDWPFIIQTGTSPDYARRRVKGHILRFTKLYAQLSDGKLDETRVGQLEGVDNVFPEIEPEYWS
jgi:1,4-alpha-glucan branching enzyme